MSLDLSGKKPVELRAIARELGIENPDRMTARELIAAIEECVSQHPPGKGDDMQSRFEVYEGEDELWYWRHVADNGEQLAKSSEGYDSKWNAARARDRAIELAAEEWNREKGI